MTIKSVSGGRSVKGIQDIAEPYRNLVSNLLKTLLSMFGDRLISLIVYGSVARGDARQSSDLDLLIIIEGLPESRLDRNKIFDAIEDLLTKDLEDLHASGYHMTLSPILKTPEEARKISSLYLDMVEDAVIVYDKNRFFESILARLSKKLKELGAERVWVGKKWYWRLRKDLKPGEEVIIE
ncbi:MAG: nucleotidyltransferase domain-containing protein [Candidatus Brockarchaeota archaeon]|nr:nucleotidyltransferase domain-containing protein [Candidatus Brockarchaeota archaeon]